jgi:hypothetical protein
MARTALKPSLRGVKAAISVRGLARLDGRLATVRTLVRWKRELTDSLGGEASLSAQELAVIEMIVRTKLLLDHGDSFFRCPARLTGAAKRSCRSSGSAHSYRIRWHGSWRRLVWNVAYRLRQTSRASSETTTQRKPRQTPSPNTTKATRSSPIEHSRSDAIRATVCALVQATP